MTLFLICLGSAFFFWLVVRSTKRDKASRDRADAIAARLRQAHGVQDISVSRDDDSFIGLSADDALLVVGRGDQDHAVPIADLRVVEGLRDGAALVRADRATAAAMPATPRNETELPDRIRTLALRITLADQSVHTVTVFDGGKHGVPPINESFRKAAVETEAWFRRLSTAIRPTA